MSTYNRSTLVWGLLVSCIATSPASGQDLAARLAGTWAVDGSEEMFRFDGDRCVFARSLQQTLMHVGYDDATNTITRHRLGQPEQQSSADIEFGDEGHAKLLGKDRTLSLVRVAGPSDPVPAAVRTEPMPLGSREVLDEEILEIQAELAERREREQAVRRELSEVQQSVQERYKEEGIETSPFLAPEVQGVVSRMSAIDDQNTRYFYELIADVGWIDTARFGDAANSAGFLLVQHCGNLAMLRSVVEAIKAEFDQGHEPSGPRFALMYDRLTLNLGGMQRYGSQLFGKPDGSLFFPRLEDPVGVDERRASVGLGTLEAYAKRFSSSGQVVTLPEGYAPEAGR